MICYVFKRSRRVNGLREENKIYHGKLKLDTWARPRVFSLETTDRRIAEGKLQELAKDFEREALGLVPARSVREALKQPLEKLLGDFVADLRVRGRTPGTLRKYHGTLKLLFTRLGWRELREVSSRSFIQWRAKSKLGAKSVNDVLANAQGFFRWLRQHKLLLEDPLESVQRIDTRGHPPCRRALSPKEFSTLLQVCPFFRSVVYATALQTGLRRKELNNLAKADFNLEALPPFIRVPASIAKNRKEALIPLNPELTEMLRKVMPEGTVNTFKPFRHRVPRIETLRGDLEAAGIPIRDERGRRVDFHSLRMTFGTTMLANGVHPIVVKELMRHSDLKLTTNLYTDASQLPLAKGVAALPQLPAIIDTGRIRRIQTRPKKTAVSAPVTPDSVPGRTAFPQNTTDINEKGEIPCTQICAQNGAQTGVLTGREESSAVVSESLMPNSQPTGDTSLRREKSHQGASVRAG
ncbi:MAG TPA: tyrosine-type recombinase/integrase [Opitutaceae bacterium]|nr:tyrosine-type recombinase/integrase [Opitutaceae bacterium]